MFIKSIKNAEHYIWGDKCDGWHLLKSDALSVIEEKIPSGAAEQYHFHHYAQQVFYVLAGLATFTIEGKEVIAYAGESISIPPFTKHCIANLSPEDLHILVISAPKAHGDRENV